MRLRATPIRKLPAKVNAAIKAQTAIVQDIDVQRLEVGGRVDQADLARLHKVVGHHEVALVGRDLDVVRADGGLIFVRVVETLDVRKVADVEGGDVVGGGEG